MASTRLQDIVARHEDDLLSEWVQQQLKGTATRRDLIGDDQLREQSQIFLRLLRDAMKQPLFERLRRETWTDAKALADETWRATVLLDRLALLTTEAFLKGREEVIDRRLEQGRRLADRGALLGRLGRDGHGILRETFRVPLCTAHHLQASAAAQPRAAFKQPPTTIDEPNR